MSETANFDDMTQRPAFLNRVWMGMLARGDTRRATSFPRVVVFTFCDARVIPGIGHDICH